MRKGTRRDCTQRTHFFSDFSWGPFLWREREEGLGFQFGKKPKGLEFRLDREKGKEGDVYFERGREKGKVGHRAQFVMKLDCLMLS